MSIDEIVERINNLPQEERDRIVKAIRMLNEANRKSKDFFENEYKPESAKELRERQRKIEEFYTRNRFVSEEIMTQPFTI